MPNQPPPGQPGAGWVMPPAAAPGAPSTAPAAVGPGGNAMAESPWLVMMPEPMPPAGGYEMVRLFLSSLLLLTITVINVLPCFWVDGKNACSFTKKKLNNTFVFKSSRAPLDQATSSNSSSWECPGRQEGGRTA